MTDWLQTEKGEVGQLVLIYIPAEGKPLKPKRHVPYEILQKLSPKLLHQYRGSSKEDINISHLFNTTI